MSNTRPAKKTAAKPAASTRFSVRVEAEGERPPLFEYEDSDGQVQTLIDPLVLPYEKLQELASGEPEQILARVAGEEQAAKLLSDVPYVRLMALVEAYFLHYGMTREMLAELSGNVLASPA